MKKKIISLLSLILIVCSCDNDDQDPLTRDAFEDINFWEFCLTNYDTNMDGMISKEETQVVRKMEIMASVTSLKGIEHFTELVSLKCYDPALRSMDLSANTQLVELICRYNSLSSLELYELKNLDYIDCSGSHSLSKLDLSNNHKLKYLIAYESPCLSEITLPKNAEILAIDCNNTPLKQIDLSSCRKLDRLVISSTPLESIDISGSPELTLLSCTDHKLNELDISNNRALESLYCYSSSQPKLTIYVWPGFDGIANNDYSDHEGYVDFVVK